ncbi:MAG: M48 family metalloprotease [Clostridiales bacterium]|nr:M48 family metalloprotease [Clostridiales bacterium]
MYYGTTDSVLSVNVFLILNYIVLIVCMYACEYLLFGIWYRLYNRSSVRYTKFIKKMMQYYRYRLGHPVDSKLKSPESSSLLLMFALVVPLIFPSIILSLDGWVLRCAVFLVGIIVVALQLFREEKTATKVQIGRWIRFLNSREYLAAVSGRSGREKDVVKETAGTPLSREEIRRDRMKLIPSIIAFTALVVAFVAGTVSNIRTRDFGRFEIPFGVFSSKLCNKAFCVLLVILIITILIYVYSDKNFRDEDKRKAAQFIHNKKQLAGNLLGRGKGIYVTCELKEWEKPINRMCGMLRIKQVAVITEDYVKQSFSGRIAMSARSDEGIACVVISKRELRHFLIENDSRKVYGMVCFILGHELTHIRHKDFIPARKGLTALLILAITIVIVCGAIYATTFFPERYLTFISVVQIVLLFLGLYLMKRVADRRYINYVSEYRADRIGATISGVSLDTIKAALKLDAQRDDAVHTTRFGRQKKTHPDCEHRLKEIQRGKKWGLLEYVRYAVRLNW